MRTLAVFIFLGFMVGPMWGQAPPTDTLPKRIPVSVRLGVNWADKPIVAPLLDKKDDIWLSDTVVQVKDAEKLRGDLHAESYLLANFDQWQKLDSFSKAQLYLGPPFRWLQLRPANAQARQWLMASRLERQLREGQPLRPGIWVRAQKSMLQDAENHGYPFAVIGLDSLLLDSTGGASGVLRVSPGPYFRFGALKVNGDVKLPKAMLSRYLGIQRGQPYSQAQVLAIRDQLRALPYLEQYANPSVRFAANEASVSLWLKKKKAGRFDFIVGLLPQTDPGTGDPNLILTGSLNSIFMNALGQGERLALEIERLRPETQKLDAQASFPYIAGSPLGAEGRLNIFKRDSTWVDAQGNVGLSYLLPRANKISFFVENRSSFLQRVDSAAIIRTRQLPANLDFRQTGAGVEAEWAQLDYRFNPRKGYLLQSKLYLGQHRVERNAQIEQLSDPSDSTFRFGTLYDALPSKTVRFRPEARLEGYIPFAQRFTFMVRLRGGGIFTKASITQNEQYRLGGNKLMRGFDEESLFATRWAVATTEVRLLIGGNAYMALFADGGYIENFKTTAHSIQRPIGLGAGMNFETGAGLFGISAAVGRGNPGEGFDLRASKIHIGYVSLF